MRIRKYCWSMKTNLHKPLSRRIPVAAYKIAGIASVLLLLAVVAPNIPAPVTGVAQKAASPVWQVRDSMLSAVYGAVAILETKEALVAENNQLYATISTLRREAFEAKILREENSRLRELLNRRPSEAAVAASVLARPSISPYDTMVIDAGLEEGVQKGNVVMVEGGVAIGYIGEVFSDSATVVLFSSPGLETPVVISSATPTPAVAVGWGGGNFMVTVPRDAPVNVNDPVMLPTLSPLVFATVASVERDPTNSFQEVRFRMPVNLSTLRYVLIDIGEVFDPTTYENPTSEAKPE